MIGLNFTKLFIVLSYIICWFSISTTFNDLFIFKNSLLTFTDIINFTRHISVYICLIISLILIFLQNTRDILKKNLVIFFFLLYFLSQTPGLFLTLNSTENISFIVSGVTIICTTILVNEFFSLKEKKLLIFISLAILAFIFILSFSKLFIEYIDGGNNLYGYFIEDTGIFFNKDSPRSSGLSRSCLIIILVIYLIENFFSNKKKIIFNIIKILLLSIILLFQSRTIIFLAFFTHIFIFIYEYKNSLKYFIKFLFNYLLLPLIFAVLLMEYFATEKYKAKINEQISKHGSIEKVEEKKILIEKNFPIRQFESFSSGRFEDWKSIISNFDIDNIYFGYGSQGDRYLINQTASNGILYAVVCSGIIGLFFYLLFTIIIFLKIFKNILLFREKTKINFYASLIIFVLFMRSILESSYAVFSIDLIIILTFLTLIHKDQIKNIS